MSSSLPATMVRQMLSKDLHLHRLEKLPMSTLHTLSCLLGKAMNLPPVFYRRLPLSALLDTTITIGLPALDFSPSAKSGNKKGKASSLQMRGKNRRSSTAAAGNHIVLEGQVSQGSATKFAVNGVDFIISAGTWIIGDLKFGVGARVKGLRVQDCQVQAASVVIL